MKRDYSSLVDESNEPGVDFKEIIKSKIQETIQKDSLSEAVDNIFDIMVAVKYEW